MQRYPHGDIPVEGWEPLPVPGAAYVPMVHDLLAAGWKFRAEVFAEDTMVLISCVYTRPSGLRYEYSIPVAWAEPLAPPLRRVIDHAYEVMQEQKDIMS